METKKTHTLLFSTLLFSSLIFHTFAKTHKEATNDFFSGKLSSKFSVDTSEFKTWSEPSDQPKPQTGLKEKDKIHKLPGQPPVAFNQYGGYITIDESSGRAFYYYFTEAQHPEKAKDLPLLLWLNGGPGCSSLGYGAMEELGPFRVGSDGKTLFKNKFAWNYAANVLFLESPAGVGFSYSNTTEDFVKGGDKKTAEDNYIFILNWLERFPEYKNRDFFIAGESYAGHYVPQLAHNILYHNQKAKKNIINLKGILIGNAVINRETDTPGMFSYWASHALISRETLHKILNTCDFSPRAELSEQCNANIIVAEQLYEELDVYNIYYPKCMDGNLTSIPKTFSLMNIDPCSDYYVHAYLNTPEVQEAMHANVTKLMKYDWQPCSDVLKDWTDRASTILPILKELMANGIRVWQFSGDVDGRVPITSTLDSIEAMKISIKNPWSAWYLSGEVGGFVQHYQDNFTLVTVRGAGHQMPSYQPDRSLSLVWHFISGIPLPYH